MLYTESVSCPLCGNDDAVTLTTEHYSLDSCSAELPIVRCKHCDLVRVTPRLTDRSRSAVYENDSLNTISHAYCWEESSRTSRFNPLLKRLKSINSTGLFLDAGCGAGDLLEAAAKHGDWTLIGADPSTPAANIAKGKNSFTFHNCTLEQVPYKAGSLSVITMLGVLEHVPNPADTLRHARNLLHDGGALGVYVPNFNYLWLKDHGPVAFVRSGRWSCLHPQEHLFGYTAKTLRHLLEQAGFDVLRIDVGQPFYPKNLFKALIKRISYAMAVGIQQTTGLHVGGLEVIAKKKLTNSLRRVSASDCED